jgi:hypothetical protein
LARSAEPQKPLLAAKEGDFDAAILDINLGGCRDTGGARRALVFVTGYEADIDDQFSEVPVLQKPIERQMLQRLFTPTVNVAAVAQHDGSGAAKAQART